MVFQPGLCPEDWLQDMERLSEGLLLPLLMSIQGTLSHQLLMPYPRQAFLSQESPVIRTFLCISSS